MKRLNVTIFNILREEEPKYLLKINEMRSKNLYAQATGNKSFIFLQLKKDAQVFAILQILMTKDAQK